MFHRDNFIVFLFFAVLLLSCSEKKHDNTVLCNTVSKKTIGGVSIYQKVYSSIVDSLNNWEMNKLIGTSETCNYSSFRIDSLLCFNRDKNRMVTCILESECNEDASDGIKILYGAKIKNQWCFFSGAYIVLPREMYLSKDKIHEPLSFSKLHEIAMKEVFGRYLIEKRTKKDLSWWKNTFAPEYEYKYEINEAWFDSHFKNKGICSDCITEEDFEKVWKINALSQWKK